MDVTTTVRIFHLAHGREASKHGTARKVPALRTTRPIGHVSLPQRRLSAKTQERFKLRPQAPPPQSPRIPNSQTPGPGPSFFFQSPPPPLWHPLGRPCCMVLGCWTCGAAAQLEHGQPTKLKHAQSKRRSTLLIKQSLDSLSPTQLQRKLEQLDDERVLIANTIKNLDNSRITGPPQSQKNAIDEAHVRVTANNELSEYTLRSRFSKGKAAGKPPPRTSQSMNTIVSSPTTSNSNGRRTSSTRISTARLSLWMPSFGGVDTVRESARTSIGTSELVELLRRGRRRAKYNTRVPDSECRLGLADCVRCLPRGGIYVETKHGPVQFGMPPETIKDTMSLGIKVPTVYVVPKERFNLRFGTNTCETEFPAYWNFFINGSHTTIVCHEEAQQIIHSVIDEVLEGPNEENLFQDREYARGVPASIYNARPDLAREIGYFKAPRILPGVTSTTVCSACTNRSHPALHWVSTRRFSSTACWMAAPAR